MADIKNMLVSDPRKNNIDKTAYICTDLTIGLSKSAKIDKIMLIMTCTPNNSSIKKISKANSIVCIIKKYFFPGFNSSLAIMPRAIPHTRLA